MPRTSGNRGGYAKALAADQDGEKVGKKRFKWASFNELVGRIDVNAAVHRGIRTVQLAPSDGADSFFQQELDRWAELDLSVRGQSLDSRAASCLRARTDSAHERDVLSVGSPLFVAAAAGDIPAVQQRGVPAGAEPAAAAPPPGACLRVETTHRAPRPSSSRACTP